MDKINFINKSGLLMLLLAFFGFILLGSFFWLGYVRGLAVETRLKNQGTELHEEGYRFISPLLECQTQSSHNNNFLELKTALDSIIDQFINKGYISQASVYLRDLNNGPWIGINEGEKFSPASLMKVPIMISYFKWAEYDPDILNKKVVVVLDADDTISQNIIPSETVITGEEYTIGDLISRMIRYSDNLAANTLLQHADTDLLDKTYQDLGIKIPFDGGENFLTVHDYAGFFRILYNSSYLSRDMSELALQILSTTEYNDGIVSGVPSYITVAHKFGERRIGDVLQLHDCGIIYRSNSPYLLCIMTRGDEFSEMKSVINDLSEKAFQTYGINL